MIICSAHEIWWSVSPSCCGRSAHCQLAESHRSQSADEIDQNWTQLGSDELLETRQKCSYASCDGPIHCLLCFISLVPYLIPTSILYENAPFWINKSWFLKCVVLLLQYAAEHSMFCFVFLRICLFSLVHSLLSISFWKRFFSCRLCAV